MLDSPSLLAFADATVAPRSCYADATFAPMKLPPLSSLIGRALASRVGPAALRGLLRVIIVGKPGWIGRFA